MNSLICKALKRGRDSVVKAACREKEKERERERERREREREKRKREKEKEREREREKEKERVYVLLKVNEEEAAWKVAGGPASCDSHHM